MEVVVESSEEEEDVVTEACRVSVTVVTALVGTCIVVPVVWIPKPLSDRSSTSDMAHAHKNETRMWQGTGHGDDSTGFGAIRNGNLQM